MPFDLNNDLCRYREVDERETVQFGGYIPIWGLVALLAIVLPAGRRILWQLPAATQLHAIHPGALAFGKNPMTVISPAAMKAIKKLRAV